MPKRKSAETTGKGGGSVEEKEAAILAVMLKFHMEEKHDANFDDVAHELSIHARNKNWRSVWPLLQEQGFVAPSASGKKGFQITPEGIEKGKTPEYVEFMKDKNFVATTNEEHQGRIKSRFKKNLSVKLFDMILKYGSLSRSELAGLVREKDRSHGFSYSLQELRKKELVEPNPDASTKVNGIKLRLSRKAFLKPEDRPEPEPIEPETLAEAVAWNKSTKPRNGKKTSEDADEDADEDANEDADQEEPKTRKKKPSKRSKDVKHDDANDGDDTETKEAPGDKDATDRDEDGDEKKKKKPKKSSRSRKAKSKIVKAEAAENGIKQEKETSSEELEEAEEDNGNESKDPEKITSRGIKPENDMEVKTE
ncbi:expressed unknown protein [Seminavis robusta]|uniref:Uncharacterized protein n=1 Tax=Seminavis robusta TaxID=568900 RepID=A0A9N8HFP7_9STRA|nr:expressed unknown protein [Seminavis robusta]|eukprot:Sro535_g161950.1 n/a (366) ;mRNA; f:20531-21628